MQNNNSKLNTWLLVLIVLIGAFCAWKLTENDKEVLDDTDFTPMDELQKIDSADESDYQPEDQAQAGGTTGGNSSTSLPIKYYQENIIPEAKVFINYPYNLVSPVPGSSVYEIAGDSQFSEGIKYYANPVETPTAFNGTTLTYQGTQTFGDNTYSVYANANLVKYYYIKNENVGLLFMSSSTSELRSVDLALVELE